MIVFWLLIQEIPLPDSRSTKDSSAALNNWTEKEDDGKQCLDKTKRWMENRMLTMLLSKCERALSRWRYEWVFFL